MLRERREGGKDDSVLSKEIEIELSSMFLQLRLAQQKAGRGKPQPQLLQT